MKIDGLKKLSGYSVDEKNSPCYTVVTCSWWVSSLKSLLTGILIIYMKRIYLYSLYIKLSCKLHKRLLGV
jgi:hypothetical protein